MAPSMRLRRNLADDGENESAGVNRYLPPPRDIDEGAYVTPLPHRLPYAIDYAHSAPPPRCLASSGILRADGYFAVRGWDYATSL